MNVLIYESYAQISCLMMDFFLSISNHVADTLGEWREKALERMDIYHILWTFLENKQQKKLWKV